MPVRSRRLFRDRPTTTVQVSIERSTCSAHPKTTSDDYTMTDITLLTSLLSLALIILLNYHLQVNYLGLGLDGADFLVEESQTVDSLLVNAYQGFLHLDVDFGPRLSHYFLFLSEFFKQIDEIESCVIHHRFILIHADTSVTKILSVDGIDATSVVEMTTVEEESLQDNILVFEFLLADNTVGI
jgi:hypothetical protein